MDIEHAHGDGLNDERRTRADIEDVTPDARLYATRATLEIKTHRVATVMAGAVSGVIERQPVKPCKRKRIAETSDRHEARLAAAAKPSHSRGHAFASGAVHIMVLEITDREVHHAPVIECNCALHVCGMGAHGD
jgi:hypothetical protein